jgi:class 3 adenylate cyclase/CHASE2 domain-containing sensor protein
MPSNRLHLSRTWRSTIVAVAIGLFAPLLTLTLPDIEALASKKPITEATRATAIQALFDKLDTVLYDYLFLFRGPHAQIPKAGVQPEPGIPEVVIITLDDNGVTTVNDLYKRLNSHYPFPRRVYADLVRKVKNAGASVIGFDILFTSPSSYNRSPQNPDDDREFAAAIKQCGNVVLAATFGSRQNERTDFIAQIRDFPVETLRTSARATSPVNVPKDNLDRDIRRFHLTETGPDDPSLPIGEKQYATFAVMIAALHWKQFVSEDPAVKAMQAKQFDEKMLNGFARGRFGDMPMYFHRQDSQTLQDSRSINICFAGYPGTNTCALRSIGDVLDPKNAGLLETWFRDKIVLVGSWSDADQDFVSTPLVPRAHERTTAAPNEQQEQYTLDISRTAEADHRYGVDVHANIIHTLLAQHVYRDFDEARRVVMVWMCGLVTALLVVRLRPVRALVPIVSMMAVIVWLVFFSFWHFVVLRPVQMGFAAMLAFGMESVYFYSVEDRRARLARSTFQRYVGPRVMERVLDTDFKPGTVEQRHLTIIFTDVQGFTSLSEKMSPHDVVDTFNRYLNEMVEIIDKHGGTLDKIMGDGVMAYFNAPLPVEHHEQKAVECALEMQAAMRAWRELSEGLGLPPLKVRIGINAGDVVFGEVGAKRQLGYTVIGDAVNAAARLEPLNKEFGTEILISEIVRAQLDDTFETEYVGELAIRGREEGIRAYSVTGRKKSAPEG